MINVTICISFKNNKKTISHFSNFVFQMIRFSILFIFYFNNLFFIKNSFQFRHL